MKELYEKLIAELGDKFDDVALYYTHALVSPYNYHIALRKGISEIYLSFDSHDSKYVQFATRFTQEVYHIGEIIRVIKFKFGIE